MTIAIVALVIIYCIGIFFTSFDGSRGRDRTSNGIGGSRNGRSDRDTASCQYGDEYVVDSDPHRGIFVVKASQTRRRMKTSTLVVFQLIPQLCKPNTENHEKEVTAFNDFTFVRGEQCSMVATLQCNIKNLCLRRLMTLSTRGYVTMVAI